MRAYGQVLCEALTSGQVRDAEGNLRSLNSGISDISAAKLQELMALVKPRRSLEVGFAMGISTLALLYAHQKLGDGTHVSIDPNQTGKGEEGWRGIGLAMVRAAGLADRLELIEAPSHLALPKLLATGLRFDFIFIDGWHSFDYTFVDYFYSDLLLNDGGILVFDDAGMPQVHKVCRFVETHKAYERIGGMISGPPMNPWRRLKRRLLRSEATSEWGSIQAYRKLRSTTVPWAFFQSDFYPYFRLYRHWIALRGLTRQRPYEVAAPQNGSGRS